MIWLDGLADSLVQELDASFAEHRDDRGAWPTTRPAERCGLALGRNLRHATRPRIHSRESLIQLPFADWRASLERRCDERGPASARAYLMEFAKPN